MTDDEYKINEECKDRFGGPDDIALGSLRATILHVMNNGVRIRDALEIPSMKMKNIATVNYMIGKLEAAKDILDDVDGYNPRIEDYLGADTRDEYDAALLRARKAVREMFTILTNEVKEHNRVLDVWKDEEAGSDDEGA